MKTVKVFLIAVAAFCFAGTAKAQVSVGISAHFGTPAPRMVVVDRGYGYYDRPVYVRHYRRPVVVNRYYRPSYGPGYYRRPVVVRNYYRGPVGRAHGYYRGPVRGRAVGHYRR